MPRRASPYRKAIEYIEIVPADEVEGQQELAPARINALALADLNRVKKELRASVGDGYGSAYASSGPELRGGFDPGIVVAEGDSWFDYLPGIDLLDWLTGDWGWDIRRFGNAGDLLKDMIHGIEDPRGSQISKLLRKVEEYQPRVLLFSGGGNDVAGEELDNYLDPVESQCHPLNIEYATVQIDRFECYFKDLIKLVKGRCTNTRIFTHGYGYMPVSGRGVRLFPRGWDFVGPWLRPSLLKHGIDDPDEQAEIIARLIDMYNDMLARVASEHQDKFTYIDLRGVISMNDWANELHLTNTGYRRCAAVFRRTIAETFDED